MLKSKKSQKILSDRHFLEERIDVKFIRFRAFLKEQWFFENPDFKVGSYGSVLKLIDSLTIN